MELDLLEVASPASVNLSPVSLGLKNMGCVATSGDGGWVA